MVEENKNGAGREVGRRSTNPFWMVGCRVPATSKKRGRIFVRAALAMVFE
jgi:hypothetical protein